MGNLECSCQHRRANPLSLSLRSQYAKMISCQTILLLSACISLSSSPIVLIVSLPAQMEFQITGWLSSCRSNHSHSQPSPAKGGGLSWRGRREAQVPALLDLRGALVTNSDALSYRRSAFSATDHKPRIPHGPKSSVNKLLSHHRRPDHSPIPRWEGREREREREGGPD